MSWRRVGKSFQALSAHFLLLCFTVLLVVKLDHFADFSWWVVFFPVWVFHAVVARGRFSLPAPSIPYDRHWAPCHAVVATPLLIAFELLLCIYLESIYVYHSAAVNLKFVFLPLLAFEIIILIDNFRMCKALLPGDEESMNDELIWETLPHFWVAISMVFFVAATLFTLLKLCVAELSRHLEHFFKEKPEVRRCRRSQLVGFVYKFWVTPVCDALSHPPSDWWLQLELTKINICFGSIAECFAFLVCTKWSNPTIHRSSDARGASSSSTTIRQLDWNSGLVVSSEEEPHSRICGLQDLGGHIMKIPIILFQVLLCMRLEGTPAGARHISLPVIFLPIFLLQGAGVLFATLRFVEKTVLLLRSGAAVGQYHVISSRVRDCFAFMHHGSRLLGWWSIDESSREEQARLYHDGFPGLSKLYPLGCGPSPNPANAGYYPSGWPNGLGLGLPCWRSQVRNPLLAKARGLPYGLSSSHRACLVYSTFCGYPPEIVKKLPKKDLAEEVWRLQAALGEQAEITKLSQQEYERLQNVNFLISLRLSQLCDAGDKIFHLFPVYCMTVAWTTLF
ncbi:hypothetical protein H5410_018836 [Solanum commersonii]|uniref:Transmembrane Fragile-X-F-associated protein n=1 Tax=Solanum commersonii TaxID=4109 RepID=A0A9J6A497_SOLCO|nr:hypothetical protein H5410_018836 [Solanum commersonii]